MFSDFYQLLYINLSHIIYLFIFESFQMWLTLTSLQIPAEWIFVTAGL